ncbi:MAG: DEAD/DEAH box helicase [Pseudomonadota bacterium]
MTDNWVGLGLIDPLRDALKRAAFTDPSPIQAKAIGPQIEGRDVLALAETGSGKTAAFVLPILQDLADMDGRARPNTARCLVLVPTRELAVQIEESLRRLRGAIRASTLLILGGMSRAAQIRAMGRGVDVLIATPGRLTDLMQAGHVRLDETRVLVLDEADRMLDMGFSKQVQAIARTLHPRRRTAMFSATMPDSVAELAAWFLKDPVRVEVARSGQTAPKIEQSVELIPHKEKRARLAEILSQPGLERCIVFTRTKRGADRVTENLAKDGISAGAIHGNKSQNARQRVLTAFRSGKIRVLVASDIAARGIDVPGISHVVQYEMPDEPEAYVHRIGRTGRNGAAGIAIALCSEDERDKLRAVERLTKLSLAPGSETRLPARKKSGGQPAKGKPRAPSPREVPTEEANRQRRRPRRPRRRAAA